MKKLLRRYRRAIERNWSLEAAKICFPVLAIAYIVLYLYHQK